MGKNKNKGKAGKSQFVPAPPRTAFDEDEPRCQSRKAFLVFTASK